MWFASWFGLLAGVGLLTQLSALQAQPAATTNYVLELDGKNSYVELPPNIFNHLTNATVEGWVKWNAFGVRSRFFDFGKAWQTMLVSSGWGGPSDLRFYNHWLQTA